VIWPSQFYLSQTRKGSFLVRGLKVDESVISVERKGKRDWGCSTGPKPEDGPIDDRAGCCDNSAGTRLPDNGGARVIYVYLFASPT